MTNVNDTKSDDAQLSSDPQECPECKQQLLHFDPQYKLYECKNEKCLATFSAEDYNRKIDQSISSDSDSEPKLGKPVVGNQFFDLNTRRWKSLKFRRVPISLSQTFGAVMLIVVILPIFAFGLIRIASSWLHWISLPWIEGWGELYFWGIPWEIFLVIGGLYSIYKGMIEMESIRKGLIVLASISAVIFIGLWVALPGNIINVLFWQGPDGERQEAYVIGEEARFDLSALVVGADRHLIWLHNNPSAENPTWAELRQFLLEDKTDKISYQDNSFVCGDYAELVHNNAETLGIRAGYVCIDFYNTNIGHAINVFRTTDHGLIYIDCTGVPSADLNADKRVALANNSSYIAVSIFDNPDYEAEWETMGQVSDFVVQW